MSRRLVRAWLARAMSVGSLALALSSGSAFAQHDEAPVGEHATEAGHAEHGGGHHACPEDAVCEAGSSAHECECYWENHINWTSWDYKATPAQEPQHRHMPPPFLFALINFAVFAAVMYRLAAQPLRDFVRARHTTIRKDLDEAQALHREADVRLKDYESKIAGMDREIDALLSQVKREAEAEKARIIASAEEQARRLQVEANRQIADAIERTRGELKAETVTAAIAIAERLLSQQSTADDSTRLAERFVGALETGAHLGNLPGAPRPTAPPPAASVARS